MKEEDKTKEQLISELAEQRGKNEELKRLLDMIELAKQEWELAVDSLSQVVCLLDREGNILRANMAVEKWKISRVKNIKGVGMHELLHSDTKELERVGVHKLFHPSCTAQNCYLETFWSGALEALKKGQSSSIESEDTIMERYIHIQILTKTVYDYNKRKIEDVFAVLLVDDITERKELEKKIKNKVQDLENFHGFAVDRELRMKELKEEIKRLEEELQKKQ